MRHVVEKIVSEEGEGELWLNYYVRGTPPPPPPPIHIQLLSLQVYIITTLIF